MVNYQDKVYEMFPKLEVRPNALTVQVLDGFNKEGEEVFSEEEDEDIYGEEGEDEYDLDEEELAELKRKGITPEQFLNGEGGFDDEEGEDDYGDEDQFDD